MDLYTKGRRKTLCRLPKPEPKAEYQCRALLLAMGAGEADGDRRGWWRQTRLAGAGEANGGGKPPASCPSPPASQTKEATGPNP
jgi:hypothetical protein